MSQSRASGEPTPTRLVSRRRAIRRGINLVFLVLILYFWYRYLARHWHELAEIRWQVSWQENLLALVLALTGYAVRGASWGPLRGEFTGQQLGLLEAFRISALAWTGRYLPGKVWSLGFRAYLSSASPDEIGQNTVAAAVDTIWFQLSGVLLVLVLSAFGGSYLGVLGHLVWLLPPALGLVLLGCHPRIFHPLVNRLLKASRQTPLPRPPRFGAMLALLGINVLTFMLIGAGFAVLVRAAGGLPLSAMGAVVGLFVAAWVGGFIVLFAPAGLGVRETILGIGLGQILDLDPATVIPLVAASRVLPTGAELLCFVAALGLTAALPSSGKRGWERRKSA